MSGAEPPLRIVKHVLNRTKGNPLYTIETTEGLLASEVLIVVLGECQITSSLDTNNLHLSVPLPGESCVSTCSFTNILNVKHVSLAFQHVSLTFFFFFFFCDIFQNIECFLVFISCLIEQH